MPINPLTKKQINERKARKMRKERELELKRIVAEKKDSSAVAQWLYNEEMLIVEDEIRKLGGFETRGADIIDPPNHPSSENNDKPRLRHDKIIVTLGMSLFMLLMFYIIMEAIR